MKNRDATWKQEHPIRSIDYKMILMPWAYKQEWKWRINKLFPFTRKK